MWPSLETASSIYDWANVFLIGALVVGVVSTVLVVWMGNKKEEYLRRELSTAAERIETLRESNLKLEARLAPRSLTPAQSKSIGDKISRFKGQHVGIGANPSLPESEMLSRVIGGALSLGGWQIITEAPSHMPMYPGGVVVASTENPLKH